ncbi:MAG TPA: RNB domain-containing ribonuclease, partial [Bacteroidales bacterium]|nr:RNB domain-containing ribonuclease [Bacteroidales bacterium]
MSKHIKAKKKTKQKLSNKIIRLFQEQPQLQANYKQIAGKLAVTNKATRNLIVEVLEEMAKNNIISEVSRGKYKLNIKNTYLTGKITMHSQGYAHCISEDYKDPVFVAHRNLHCALDGDLVKIFLLPLKKGKEPEGIVSEIIERSRKKIVGTIQLTKSFAFLVPDNRKIPYDIFIPPDKLPENIENNMKATIRIIEWTRKMKNPIGEIINVLGYAGDNETEQHAILEEFELPYTFSKAVKQEANKISKKIPEQEIAKRKDYRNILTFTIDPVDAKDFDDAISYRKLKNGNIEIGVHIADVSYYVRQNNILDKEAYLRGTSVYLVDRVIPMLPETLSNNLCSLRPNEDKLTFSVLFEFDSKDFHIVNHHFYKTIIRSNRRFHYDEVQEILDKEKGDLFAELKQINEITQAIRKKRFDDGALSFERTEIKFKLDKEGKPLDIIFKETNQAHQLIEELMLLANKYVATKFNIYEKKHRNSSFVYRVHDKPDQEKLRSFAQFIKQFGYKLN